MRLGTPGLQINESWVWEASIMRRYRAARDSDIGRHTKAHERDSWAGAIRHELNVPSWHFCQHGRLPTGLVYRYEQENS